MSANENIFIDDRPLSPTVLMAKGVFLEALRRREFYVVLLFMGLFLAGAVLVRVVGTENTATASFILNLGLSLSVIFGQIVTVLTAARQFPDELEQRTLYPLLAKPVTRGQYVLAKWAASALAGIGVFMLLCLMAYLPAVKPPAFTGAKFFQMIIVQVAALGAVSGLTMLGSLLLPKVMNMVVMALTIMLGGTAAGLIRSYFSGSGAREIAWWVTGYIPDFARLNLVKMATSASPPLDGFSLTMRLGYALVLAVVTVSASAWLLRRRVL